MGECWHCRYVLFGFHRRFISGRENIKTSDWLSLAGAGTGLVLWALTNNPFGAVALVAVIDALGFIPTFRKSFYKPYEETMSTFMVSTLKYAISLPALESFNPTTWLFPASLVLTNGSFVILLLIRRKQSHT